MSGVLAERVFRPWRYARGLARSILTRRPAWCTWQATYRCQLRCRFCDYWRHGPPAEEELSPAAFARGAENLARIGTLFVSLAGGEPLLRDDLERIVAAVARHHMTFITTNGQGLSAERARSLWAAGLWGASVSIDYADPARHDSARGRRGAFDQAVHALEVLSATRSAWFQEVNLMAVLMHDNLDDLDALTVVAQRHGASLMVQPYSPMKTGSRSFLPAGPVSRHLLALKRRRPNFISNRWFLARFDDYLKGGVPNCGAGRRFFNIDHAGRVSRCVEEIDRPLGSILEEPMEVLLRRLRRRAADDHRSGHPCRDCWYNCRGEVEAFCTARGLFEALPTYLPGPRRSRRNGHVRRLPSLLLTEVLQARG